jgi:predicted NUDIX family NTP pyrophosphohydrolase
MTNDTLQRRMIGRVASAGLARLASVTAAKCSAVDEANLQPMPKRSAGLLLHRRAGDGIEVLLVHPGGPFWAKRDDGAWGIPKGEYMEGEDALAAARREFEEETGMRPVGPFVALGSFRQSGAKIISVWAMEGDFDPATLKSNNFTMQWPPRSGRMQSFPEVDRAEWFSRQEAERKILPGQRAVLAVLFERLGLSHAAP